MYSSSIIKNLDYKIFDISKEYIDSYKNKSSESNVVIVDIDEKSLDAIGQWPWSRVILATLLSKISATSPAAIGIDIIFPEKDRTSLKQIKNFYKNYFNIDINVTGIPHDLQDNDAIFADILKSTQSVMSIYLSREKISNDSYEVKSKLEITPNIFAVKNYPYVLQNTPELTSGVENFGFINTNIDEDGILRRYQLVKKYQDKLVPSLGLETLLSISPELKVSRNNFEVMQHKFETDQKSNVLLSFYHDSWYKKVSVLDILSNSVNAEQLRGKIVLIGSSATALHDQVVVPKGRSMAGIQVHATMIDNLLHDELLVQPQNFKLINIYIALVLTLLLAFLLFKKENSYILLLFISVVVLSVFINFYSLWNGLYLSIGYFLLPFLMHFFLISIIFIFIDTYDKKEFSQELNRSHIAFMDSMSHVAEVHDFETGAHIVRTKKYIKLLAEYIYSKGIYKNELSREMIEMMYFTSPMHDIGKIGIADAILKKEGKLTDMEYEVMKTHADLGKHIINNAISSYKGNSFLIMAKNIAHYHHEKWDGSGYPEGLKGEEIPLESRFMAISDVYDALVSKRVYKGAFSFEKTVEIIKDGKGTHFDPVLVDAFMEIKEEFYKIAQEYQD
ncbi:MAG: CHASE2 domain-containing protein [Sulfurimonas sp.]|nr:CHASE2 domain-containing protein [Sulfurimonas sp.]